MGLRWLLACLGGQILMKATRDQVRELYASGLSGKQVSALTGWGKSPIHRAVKDIARTQAETKLLRPAETLHPNSSRGRARRLMEKHLGRKLARRENVHHKNENCFDNRLENLQVMDISDHRKHHSPKDPTPRHQRPNRVAWRQAYTPLLVKTLDAVCLQCENPFKTFRYQPAETCSKSCAGKLAWKRKAA